jgi:eukaryotic-like serine/threonine-protein kinase
LRFVVRPAEGVINPFEGPPAISPDGRMLAYTSVLDGVQRIWVRALDSLVARPIPRTETGASLFWSPDSRSLGFWSQPGVLKRVEVSGWSPQTICETKGRSLGATWNAAGMILFHSLGAPGLNQGPASGGAPRLVTTAGAGEQHLVPSFLPDGRQFVFGVMSRDANRQGVYIGSLESSQIERVLPGALIAHYTPPGYFVFVRDGKLMAQRFDLSRLRTDGDAQLVADKPWSQGQLADYSVSNSGVLAFTEEYLPPGQLTWVDRAGRRLGTAGSVGPFVHLDLSPDEGRVLFERRNEGGGGDLWVLDLRRGESLIRLTSDEWAYAGLWSPDGTKVVYAHSGTESEGLTNYVKRSDGAGERELFSRGGAPSDWSRDGSLVVQYVGLPVSGGLTIVPATGARQARPYLETTPEAKVVAQGRLSPDGRWMAYTSMESMTPEGYVRPFPSSDRRFAVSTNGGTHPRWRADGREIFYLGRDGNLMAAPVQPGPDLQVGAPVPLFALLPVGYPGRSDYAVTKDGQRFLVNRRTGPEISYSITVMIDWLQTLAG